MPYSNGLPPDILVHTAIPQSYEEARSGAWVEGEPGTSPEPVAGVPFACVLFLPSPGGAQDTPYRPRVVRTPTLLFNPLRDDGSVVTVSSEDELLIDAAELAGWTGGISPARWLADGDAQPFGPPGAVIGVQATLRMVKD